MKHLIWILLLLSISCSVAFAQNSGFGAGIMISEPSALNLKYWINSSSAFAGSIAWKQINNHVLNDQYAYVDEKTTRTTIMLDYLWHTNPMSEGNIAQVKPYFGLGFRTDTEGGTEFKVRMPIGLDFMMQTIPVDAYVEFIPMLKLNPSTEADARAAMGVRVWLTK
jgi:hypothetical protein